MTDTFKVGDRVKLTADCEYVKLGQVFPNMPTCMVSGDEGTVVRIGKLYINADLDKWPRAIEWPEHITGWALRPDEIEPA